MTDEPLLSIQDVQTHFHTDDGLVRAVDGVSFDVDRGETVCVVGESGSGKSVTCETVTQLIPMPPGEIAGGEVYFDGVDVTALPDDELRELRGGRIGHVFQNPQGALNPVYTVGYQIREAIDAHHDVSKAEARQRAVDLLEAVGIPEAATRVDDYPHEFSGGMKQRVVIAMALVCEPDLLIADEPTTALDVTIEAQILDLFRDLQDEYDMGIVFVTHDLGVVAEIADTVVVMYAGKVMETGSVEDIFENPAHPYTKALLECLPGQSNLEPIPGSLPSTTDPPDGCRFHARCEYATEECRVGEQPPLYEIGDEHQVSCIHWRDDIDELPDPAEVHDATVSLEGEL
ncbi:ABC transporter ATP-binding protein [Natronorubrum daqingense]|uniref:Nickel import system ATP-binding protein NikD n=1 Tax=Natronorubrum daqingense TaxID=588898 RepID=A0A1N6ZYU2_9EURY|nr:ABC transporter ATP-binding protein [Natronorubrum daqingense]APX95201.1 peptide ABC transporter ATP-binding protein [Natronorubrum daqingense]SIR31926.1 peptide/nickel transport system ATP-binding protein [Natronorubrum daqingense]